MTQFIVCMDISYSMSGKRINTAKNMVKGVDTCSNYRAYYYFNDSYKEVTKEEFYNLSIDGFTNIEHTLNGMFNVELPKYKNNDTRFFFVTDACDSISDKESLKKKLDSLQNQFTNGLHSKIILIDGGGECKEALKYIFGGDNMHNTTDKDFGKLSKKLVAATKLTSDTKKSVTDIQNILNKLTYNSNANIDKTREQLTKIESNISIIKTNIQNSSKQIESIRNDFDKINVKYDDTIQQAKHATTDDQIEKCENDLETLQDNYDKIREQIIAAQMKANKSELELLQQQRKTDDIAANIQKNDKELKNKVNNIKKEISKLIQNIKDIKKFDPKSTEIKSIRKQIKNMTTKARKLTNTSIEESKMIREMEKNILDWFKIMKKDEQKAKNMRNDIENKMETISNILDELFDKA